MSAHHAQHKAGEAKCRALGLSIAYEVSIALALFCYGAHIDGLGREK